MDSKADYGLGESEARMNEKRLKYIANKPIGELDMFEFAPVEIRQLASALLAAQRRVAELEEENKELEKRIDEHECGMGVSVDYDESEKLEKRLKVLREQR